MKLSNNIISSLSEKITPYIKKGVKSAESSNRIYFKPEDVPVLDEIPQPQDISVSKDATIAPFADRLIHPDLFGLTPNIRETSKLIKNTESLIEKCTDIALKNRFSTFYSKILDNTKNIPKETNRMTSLMSAVELIDNPKIKENILNKIDFLNKEDSRGFKEFYPGLMSFMEKYADAANTLNGKYSNINNRIGKFFNWMDKNDIWLMDIIQGTKKTEATYRKGLVSSRKRNKKYPEYLRNYDEYTSKGFAQTFENSVRQDAMKQFLDKYFNTRKEEVYTLYHEEYLKTLPSDIAKECAEIQKEYNTYIITSNADTTLEDIKYIREELNLWRQAGKDEVIMPKAIYINTADEYMMKNKSGGYADLSKDTVTVRELLEYDGNADRDGSVLRHELQHIHDIDAKTPKSVIKCLKDRVLWKYNKTRYGKKWEKELRNAGIKNEKHIAYAFDIDKSELRSVTAETKMKDLSESYKNDMKNKFKMQSWIFDIGDNKIAEQRKLINS